MMFKAPASPKDQPIFKSFSENQFKNDLKAEWKCRYLSECCCLPGVSFTILNILNKK